MDPTSKVDKVLEELLPSNLDGDSFFLSRTKIPDQGLSQANMLVSQIGTTPSYKLQEIISPISARSVAVVDRSADISVAAKTIVTARLSSHGSTSPYSPDLVIANDFIREAFGKACLEEAKGLSYTERTGYEETRKALIAAEKKGQVKIQSLAGVNIVEISDRYVIKIGSVCD